MKFWPGEVVKIPENAYKYGLGTLTLAVTFAWRDHDEYVIPAAEVARIDRANMAERRALASQPGTA